MKELLTKNLKYKIIALLLSLLAWFYVQSSPTSTFLSLGDRRISLGIEYLNLQPDLKIVDCTKKVELILRQGVTNFWVKKNLRAYVDLRQIKRPGNYYLKIDVEVANNVEIISQEPTYALILIEEVE